MLTNDARHGMRALFLGRFRRGLWWTFGLSCMLAWLWSQPPEIMVSLAMKTARHRRLFDLLQDTLSGWFLCAVVVSSLVSVTWMRVNADPEVAQVPDGAVLLKTDIFRLAALAALGCSLTAWIAPLLGILARSSSNIGSAAAALFIFDEGPNDVAWFWGYWAIKALATLADYLIGFLFLSWLAVQGGRGIWRAAGALGLIAVMRATSLVGEEILGLWEESPLPGGMKSIVALELFHLCMVIPMLVLAVGSIWRELRRRPNEQVASERAWGR